MYESELRLSLAARALDFGTQQGRSNPPSPFPTAFQDLTLTMKLQRLPSGVEFGFFMCHSHFPLPLEIRSMKGSRSLVWYLRHTRELAAPAASASDAMFNFPSSSRFRVLNDQIDDHTTIHHVSIQLTCPHPLGSSLRLMSFHSLILRFNRFPPLFHNRAAAIFSFF